MQLVLWLNIKAIIKKSSVYTHLTTSYLKRIYLHNPMTYSIQSKIVYLG